MLATPAPTSMPNQPYRSLKLAELQGLRSSVLFRSVISRHWVYGAPLSAEIPVPLLHTCPHTGMTPQPAATIRVCDCVTFTPAIRLTSLLARPCSEECLRTFIKVSQLRYFVLKQEERLLVRASQWARCVAHHSHTSSSIRRWCMHEKTALLVR